MESLDIFKRTRCHELNGSVAGGLIGQNMIKIGQRWLWDRRDYSKFIVEIIELDPTRVIIKQVFRGRFYIGETFEWDPEQDNEDRDFAWWSLLEQQHSPE